MDTIQVVWTHDCEHGQIRGFKVVPVADEVGSMVSVEVDESMEYVEFGPEQLIARISSSWNDTDEMSGYLDVPLPSLLMNSD